MSADNWTTCPRCDKKREAALAAARKKIEASYGKVPAAEYVEKLQKLESSENAPRETKLREDYEIGIHEGEFEVRYRASCNVCDFTHEFNYTQGSLS